MNEVIKDLLSRSEQQFDQYVLQRIVELEQQVEEQQQEIERYKAGYEYIDKAIYTQHCTMNHMENTDFERGQINGLTTAGNIVTKTLGNTR